MGRSALKFGRGGCEFSTEKTAPVRKLAPAGRSALKFGRGGCEFRTENTMPVRKFAPVGRSPLKFGSGGCVFRTENGPDNIQPCGLSGVRIGWLAGSSGSVAAVFSSPSPKPSPSVSVFRGSVPRVISWEFFRPSPSGSALGSEPGTEKVLSSELAVGEELPAVLVAITTNLDWREPEGASVMLAKVPEASITMFEGVRLPVPEREKVAPLRFVPVTLTVTLCPASPARGKTFVTVGTGATRRLNANEAVWPMLSVTLTVKLLVPPVVAMPVSAPVDGFRSRPLGRAPEVTAKMRGATPLAVWMVWE